MVTMQAVGRGPPRRGDEGVGHFVDLVVAFVELCRLGHQLVGPVVPLI
jgi:hypothetical protein